MPVPVPVPVPVVAHWHRRCRGETEVIVLIVAGIPALIPGICAQLSAERPHRRQVQMRPCLLGVDLQRPRQRNPRLSLTGMSLTGRATVIKV